MLTNKGQKIYTVYMKPDDEFPLETIEFVPEEASVFGFIFHLLWCFYHRLWLHGLVIAIIWGIVITDGKSLGLGMASIAVIELAIRLLVMFEGNNWRQEQLLRKGYILADIVTGDSEISAKQRFLDRWFASERNAGNNPEAETGNNNILATI